MKHLLITTIAAVMLVGTVIADLIHDAAKQGDLLGAQLEFDKGVNLNARDDDGRTPLYYAANAVNADMVQLLIAEGANINELDDNGLTLLDNAEAESKKHMADLLRKHGAKSKSELHNPPTPKSIIITTILMWTGVIILVLFICWFLRREKKRTMQLAKIANRLNLPFFPEGNSLLFHRLNHFHLLSQGHSPELWNMMHGETSNVELAIFDYRYTTGSGEHSSIYNQSVIYFCSPKLKLPQFALRPEGMFHKIGSVLGYQDIDFESHPDFSKKYLLRGDDESKIRVLFNNELLNYFESQHKISVEGGSDQLIFYRAAKRIKHLEVQQFMGEGFQVFQQFLGSA